MNLKKLSLSAFIVCFVTLFVLISLSNAYTLSSDYWRINTGARKGTMNRVKIPVTAKLKLNGYETATVTTEVGSGECWLTYVPALTTTETGYIQVVAKTKYPTTENSGVDENETLNLSLVTGSYLPLSGGDLTGSLGMGFNDITSVGTPDAYLDAATKGYVDDVDVLKLAKAGDTMTGPITVAATGIFFDDGTNQTTLGFIGTTDADAKYVNRAGSSMTGLFTTEAIDFNWNDLTNVGTPDAAFEAATKDYVDTADALLAPIAGVTFTDVVTLDAAGIMIGATVPITGLLSFTAEGFTIVITSESGLITEWGVY